MNIYKISQNINRDYDTYDSAIVVAPNEEIAKRIHPEYKQYEFFDEKNQILPLTENNFMFLNSDWRDENDTYIWEDWVMNVNDIKVELVGYTDLYDEPRVLCASFNAG